jgi:hypothetical protein
MNANLKAELVKEFTAQITRSVTSTFNYLVEQFGPTLNGVYNSRSYKVWRNTVQFCVVRTGTGTRRDEPYIICEQSLAKFAAALADQWATEVLGKVDAKVGELTDPNVVYAGSANFVITGTKNGRGVRIDQQQIINCSSKGTLFNQYPSRIYVDGKFTPASKFAAI